MVYYTIENDIIWTINTNPDCYRNKVPMHNIIKNKTVILPPFYGISEGRLIYYKLVGNTLNTNKVFKEFFIRYLTKEDYYNLNNGLPIFILDYKYHLRFNTITDNTTMETIDNIENIDKYQHKNPCLIIDYEK